MTTGEGNTQTYGQRRGGGKELFKDELTVPINQLVQSLPWMREDVYQLKCIRPNEVDYYHSSGRMITWAAN